MGKYRSKWKKYKRLFEGLSFEFVDFGVLSMEILWTLVYR